MKTNTLYFLFLLIESSCSFTNNPPNELTLPGNWRLYYVEQIKMSESSDSSFAISAGLKKIVKDGALLSLFEDGSYSELIGKEDYKTGNWKFLEKQKTISFVDSVVGVRDIAGRIENNRNGKQILTILNSRKNVALKFIKESEPLKDFKNDPFYESNNQWRIKPTEPESSIQLKNRLANYFKHLALILKSAKDRNQTVVSFAFSQGPVQIYNGGIGIYGYNILPEYWKDSFFDELDACAAYLKYEKYLKTNSHKGVGIGEWIEDDYTILLSIYADFSQAE